MGRGPGISMNAGKWPSPDADSATFIRFLKRRLQCLEDRSMSADPGDLLVAYNHGRIESLRGAIKALETEDSDASPEEDKQTSAPTPATVAPVVLIDGGVFASFNYDNRLQVSARGVPALAENILCHLVSP